jgi:hypothetical protein
MIDRGDLQDFCGSRRDQSIENEMKGNHRKTTVQFHQLEEGLGKVIGKQPCEASRAENQGIHCRVTVQNRGWKNHRRVRVSLSKLPFDYGGSQDFYRSKRDRREQFPVGELGVGRP